MLRFSIKTLLIVVTLVALLIWWFDDGWRVIHQETSKTHGALVVYGKKDRESDKFLLKVKYRPNGASADNTHLSDAFELRESAQSLPASFSSVVDIAGEYWCVYDDDQQRVVIVVAPLTKGDNVDQSIWHPGVHIGWARGLWHKIYMDLKKSHPQLPYKSLPGEMRIATQ